MYTTNGPDVISLHFNLSDKCIYILNFDNPVNIEETSTSISVLKCKLAAHLNIQHIVLGEFNFHHKVKKDAIASNAFIENLKELLIITQR